VVPVEVWVEGEVLEEVEVWVVLAALGAR